MLDHVKVKSNQRFVYLGEKSGPVGLKLTSSSLQDGGDLLSGDGDIVISQDEGGVAAGKLRVGHVGSASVAEDLAQKLRTSTKLLKYRGNY